MNVTIEQLQIVADELKAQNEALRAELAAEQNRQVVWKHQMEIAQAERDVMRELLREARNIIPRDWAFWARIDAALKERQS